MARIAMVVGDIARQRADAIVTAANTGLRGGGGVDGAIHAAAGPSLLRQCRALGGCETGDAKVTSAGGLDADWVIHAVGPVWQGGGEGEDALLVRCYTRALDLAIARGCASIAFPAISCGIFGFPVQRAAALALGALRAAEDSPLIEEIRLVLYDRPTYRIFMGALQASDARRRGPQR
jgi:O-acetyl-ADP-ribose deacetylase (regulator of RNase III)